jgi:broad specificity phosphatase PhoE
VARRDPLTRLVLARHGESRATVDRMVGGHDSCRGLTERCRVQAALAGVATEHAGATVVIVCHGGLIEGSLMALGNLPVRRRG